MSFNVWAFGDAHVPADIKQGRESLAEAFRQSEGTNNDGAPAFDWDIALDVGDNSAGQRVPDAHEGEQVIAQYGALQKHDREQIYTICGNHDRNGLHQPQADWFRTWIDPTGENPENSRIDTSKRPYPVEGTWERYSFRIGNLLVLMMSDINIPGQPLGRGDLDGVVGGNPGGAVSMETFEWWRDMVLSNPDAIIVTAHHYVLRDTTVASGVWEGMERNEDGFWESKYHGLKPWNTPDGASYLYWVGERPDAACFQKVLEAHPGRVALWLGGHTHARPDDTTGGKSHIETVMGTHFMNVCGLTRYHGQARNCTPMSRLLRFEEGSDALTVSCYLHDDTVAAPGWYDEKKRVLKLQRPFSA
jgi:hypothetical protein